MKLATFEQNNIEKWGFVIQDPVDQSDLIVVPEELEALIPQIARFTSYFELVTPKFIPDGQQWPADMQGFLSMGDEGMEILKRMENFASRFISKQDGFLLRQCSYHRREVHLKAPIPRPRLYWGLVQNSPAFFRNDPNRVVVQLYPQGHQRTQACIIGDGDIAFLVGGKDDAFPVGFNIELGVVIGRKGKYIQAKDALDYIAGYTNVLELTPRNWYNDIDREKPRVEDDFFMAATASWNGKKMDALAPMGPYVVTKDEILNPYDLESCTKQDGYVRDHGFSGQYILGIERAIEFFSSFGTLYPGDVIHLGAMQIDGLRLWSEYSYTPENSVQGGIEGLGTVTAHVMWKENYDWREPDDATYIHPSPAVRDLINHGEDCLAGPQEFDPEAVRHFWIVFGNYEEAEKLEGMARVEDIPRILNNPGRAVSGSSDTVLSKRVTGVTAGLEVGVVIKKITHNVALEDIHDYILGYTPLVSYTDTSFAEQVQGPAGRQEQQFPVLYGRWGDGYNVIGKEPVKIRSVKGRKMKLVIDGVGEAETTTDEYIMSAEKAISVASKYVTFFPGDVVSMGRTARRIEVPADVVEKGFTGRASIEGVGEMILKVRKDDGNLEKEEKAMDVSEIN